MDSINEGVIAKLQSRAKTGERKYGVTMDRNDLTMLEWLQHAQDELLDGAVYLEKLIRINGTCKWNGRMAIRQVTGCGEPWGRLEDLSFTFCPFCGRKIEVVK